MDDKKDSGKSTSRRDFLKLTALAIVASAVGSSGTGCSYRRHPEELLKDYYKHDSTRRIILPQDYIAYLKSNVFTHGELDNLPKAAVILHDCKVEEHLRRLGFSETDWKALQTGTTDPNLMYVVRRNQGPDFILNRGLPGAGGIATQAAELFALGVEYLVHIGTCGLLGSTIKEGKIILSSGSYKDGAAVLLTEQYEEKGPEFTGVIARPSEKLTTGLEIRLGSAGTFSRSVGYTMPVYYFQPEGLIKEILDKSEYLPQPEYVEMEQASLFQTAELMRKHAASMVVGADRYVKSDNHIAHKFYDVDCDAAKSRMLDVAIKTIS